MSDKPFVVLDRDGTIIVERHYLSDPTQVELLPGAVEGLAQLVALGFGLIVVTNQSGIGRGYFSETTLSQIHRRMCDLLSPHGVRLAAIAYCPHTPADACFCRKPLTGLIDRSAKELGFDPASSFVIGDKPCDIEMGRRIKAKTFLVRTGYGASVESENVVQPDYVVNNLRDAARVISKLTSRSRRTQIQKVAL